jgi:hypothetical protein
VVKISQNATVNNATTMRAALNDNFLGFNDNKNRNTRENVA